MQQQSWESLIGLLSNATTQAEREKVVRDIASLPEVENEVLRCRPAHGLQKCDLENLVQATRVWLLEEGAERLLASRSTLREFIRQNAPNLARAIRGRKRTREVFYVSDVEAECPCRVAEEVESRELEERFRRAVQKLPVGWRKPVLLTMEGYTPAEIAEEVGVSENAVSKRLSRARNELRFLLGLQ